MKARREGKRGKVDTADPGAEAEKGMNREVEADRGGEGVTVTKEELRQRREIPVGKAEHLTLERGADQRIEERGGPVATAGDLIPRKGTRRESARR